MPFLQDVLHKLEVGGGMRYFRVGLAVLAVLLLTVGYNWRAFRNMATQEAMDAAQLARNIAQGKGYTTLFIRPFSIFLVKKRNLETQGLPAVGKIADLAELRGMHPDLANPPVYPVVLAALMKVAALRLRRLRPTKPFWSNNGRFWRFKPDFLIALFNQLLFLAIVVLVFFLARRLFDPGVAWLSAGLLLGTELLWRFSVSGLSTMLLMVIFLGLAWCLVLLEEEARAPKWGPSGILVLAGLAGAMVGLGGLTRYSFGWLIIPVLVFLILFGGQRRVVLALIAARGVCGRDGAVDRPQLQRQRQALRHRHLRGRGKHHALPRKPSGALAGAGLQPPLPDGLLVQARTPTCAKSSRMTCPGWAAVGSRRSSWSGCWSGFATPPSRACATSCWGACLVLILTQALGRTQLSEESPEINSENLLVLLAPLVLVYGVSLFYLLLEQMRLPFQEVRYVVIGIFSLVACLPMLFVFLPPKDQSRRLPALLPARHPDRRGLAEGEGAGHERYPVGRGLVWPAPMRLADAKVHARCQGPEHARGFLRHQRLPETDQRPLPDARRPWTRGS